MKPNPPSFLALTTHDGHLYAVNRAGHLLALYLYAPLAQAVQRGYAVPFAPRWPRYARAFVLAYVPLPALTPEQLPDDLEPKITVQTRDGDEVRPWKQTLYNGWPLYFATPGVVEAVTDPAPPSLFRPATVDVPTPHDLPVEAPDLEEGEDDLGGGDPLKLGP